MKSGSFELNGHLSEEKAKLLQLNRRKWRKALEENSAENQKNTKPISKKKKNTNKGKTKIDQKSYEVFNCV